MKTSDFYYELPKELIAQSPAEKRDESRLMILEKSTGKVTHSHFYHLPDLLRPGDLLVMNDSRVIPARLLGERISSDGEKYPCEILLLKNRGENTWETLAKPGRKLKKGTRVTFGNDLLQGEIVGGTEDGNKFVKFYFDGIFEELLDKLGEMPLPPYITAYHGDMERYQTVYSKNPGSAAAPTAGLHFTNEIIDTLHQKGIDTAFITLHVGLGTFRPVKVEDVTEHHMHSEFYMISEETAQKIRTTRERGGRVIAVGTTTCRTLETAARDGNGQIDAVSGWTDIFIYPGFTFRAIDGLITNFHLPESTLLMLVSALAGKENIMAAYEEAIRERYRFFSFGDAMLIC